MSYRSVAHSFLAFELRFPFACTFPPRFEISSRTALFWASAAFSRDRCSPSCRSCLGASANRGTFFLPSCCPLLLCSSCRSNTKSLLLAQIGKPNYRFEKPLSLIRGFCKTTIRPPSSSSFGEQARRMAAHEKSFADFGSKMCFCGHKNDFAAERKGRNLLLICCLDPLLEPKVECGFQPCVFFKQGFQAVGNCRITELGKFPSGVDRPQELYSRPGLCVDA